MDSSYDTIKNEMISFLKEAFVMNLSTCYEDRPTSAPMVYVMDDELNFYFVTYRQSMKSQNIINNPKCSFTVWEFLKMSVQVDGDVSIVEDEVKKEWVIQAFADAVTRDPNFWAPIFRIQRGDYCVFKIKPTWMRVLDLTHNTVRQEESPYTEIKL